MSEVDVEGSCLCGGVRYRARGTVRGFYHCHCSRCRKATGTGHATNLMLQAAELEWLDGAEAVKSYRLPEAKRFRNNFCTRCGGPLPRDIESLGVIVIPAGSLDGDLALRPEARIFLDSRADWSCDDEPIPGYPRYQDTGRE